MIIANVFQTYFLPAIVLAVIGGIFGVLIAICSKFFYVKVDDRIETITAMLPGYNCGACGSPGCAGHAQNILENGAPINACKPIKPEQVERIKEYYEAHKND